MCCPPMFAQTAPPRELTLITGRGELLVFDSDIKTVVASEPKIADAIVVSPREVMVNAKAVGKTTVIIWETGAVPRRYNVSVTPDSTDIENIRKTIRDSVSESDIVVTGNTEMIVLTGNAKSKAESARAEALATTHAKKVTNLIVVPNPPDLRQIMLSVKIASIDRTVLSEVGFNMFSRNTGMIGETATQQFQSPRFSQLQFQNQQFSNTTVNFADLLNLFIFRPDLNIGAVIRALQNNNLLQILAEPNLVTTEGVEASFLAGGQFPFPTLTATSTGGATSPVVTVQFKKFGVQLDFLPTITPSGAIHLKVKPEVSSLDYANAVTLQGFLIPAIASRHAETEVTLKDGESFAIAGLIDSRVLRGMSKIKFLGDIPVLGQLFKSRSTSKTNDELLVVVTPHFVRPISAEDKANLPTFPENFLPIFSKEIAEKAAAAQRAREKSETASGARPEKSSRAKKAPKKEAPQPEFIGPRGQQEPK
jgi:pilus assembly protein CpaC